MNGCPGFRHVAWSDRTRSVRVPCAGRNTTSRDRGVRPLPMAAGIGTRARPAAPGVLGALPLLLAVGCVAYEPRPLDVGDEMRAVAARRASFGAAATGDDGAATISLGELAQWMQQYGPAVREAIAEWESAAARADVPTPLRNPQLQAGPRYGFGADIGAENVVNSFGTFSFWFPLGDRRERADELDRMRAAARHVDALAELQSVYLQLRAAWLDWVARGREVAQREAVLDTWQSAVAAERDAIAAGGGDALTLATAELESLRAEALFLEAERALAAVRAEIAGISGISLARLERARGDEPAWPEPPELPPLAELQTNLELRAPGLLRARAAYAVAEAALALEVAEAIPDIGVGPAFEAEPGETIWQLGLQFTLQVPLFDRNQKAIAAARAGRERARVAWQAAADRALTELEAAHADAAIARERVGLYAGGLLERARRRLEAVETLVAAGGATRRDVLAARRTVAEIEIAALQARRELAAAFVRLERASGRLLLEIPGESGGVDATAIRRSDRAAAR